MQASSLRRKQFTRTCKEVVHVELLYDHPPDTAVEFNPPSADKSETISLSRFIAECELRPLAMRRGGKVAIPLSLALYPLAAFFRYLGGALFCRISSAREN